MIRERRDGGRLRHMPLHDDIPTGTESTVQCVLMLSLAKQAENSNCCFIRKTVLCLGHVDHYQKNGTPNDSTA